MLFRDVDFLGDELFSDAHDYEEIEDGFFLKAEGKVPSGSFVSKFQGLLEGAFRPLVVD